MIKVIPMLIVYLITSAIIVFLDKNFHIVNKVNYKLEKDLCFFCALTKDIKL